MSLWRNAIRSNGLLGMMKPNQGLPILLRETPKRFCTGTEEKEQPPQPEPQPQPVRQDSSVDPFLQSPSRGFIYGKVTGTSKHTLKTDLIHLLEGCELTPEDIKVEYTWHYYPSGMIVQFPTRSAFATAVRVINRKHMYKLEKVDRSMWEIQSFESKSVLLQGIPRNAIPEDIERLLCGYNFNSSTMQMFVRSAFPDPIRMAIVQFSSVTEAMNAVRVKNRSFCLNNQVLMRVLQ